MKAFSYGLGDDEILGLDDKDLNSYVSIKKQLPNAREKDPECCWCN